MLHNCSQFRTPIVETVNMCMEFVVHYYMPSPREKIFHNTILYRVVAPLHIQQASSERAYFEYYLLGNICMCHMLETPPPRAHDGRVGVGHSWVGWGSLTHTHTTLGGEVSC